ncbi:MAG: TldD/PmbA family protein [Candidatus Hodarchaeales archaeon]|jgi:PmbA protein
MDLDTIKKDLLSIADTGLKYGMKKAPNAEIEVYITQDKIVEIEFQGGAMNSRDSVLSGIGVRIFDDQRKSFACSSGKDIESVKSVIDEAIAISQKISHKDIRFKQLTESRPPKNEGIIDPDVLLITAETLSKEAFLMIEESKKVDQRIVSIEGQRSVVGGGYAIVNSRGVSAATRVTNNVGIISAVAKEGDKQKNSLAIDISRSKNLNRDLAETAIKAAKDALKLLNSKPLNRSEEIPVIFEPFPASMYFGSTFGFSISGRAVTEGKSFYADNLGEEIAVKNLSIYDDGQLPEGLATVAIDAEGVPAQKTKIVEKGVLKSFINDTYYGNIMGTDSTGNSKRSGNPEYESSPRVGLTTITVDSGNKKKEDIISECSRGILVKNYIMGIGHTNPITGNFSVVCPTAFLIENGSISYPLEPVNVAGNLYKSLKNIAELGSDLFLSPFNVKNPSVAIEGLTVTG